MPKLLLKSIALSLVISLTVELLPAQAMASSPSPVSPSISQIFQQEAVVGYLTNFGQSLLARAKVKVSNLLASSPRAPRPRTVPVQTLGKFGGMLGIASLAGLALLSPPSAAALTGTMQSAAEADPLFTLPFVTNLIVSITTTALGCWRVMIESDRWDTAHRDPDFNKKQKNHRSNAVISGIMGAMFAGLGLGTLVENLITTRDIRATIGSFVIALLGGFLFHLVRRHFYRKAENSRTQDPRVGQHFSLPSDLLIMKILHDQGGTASTVEIATALQERIGKLPNMGSLYVALERLEQEGFIWTSPGGPTKIRGGRDTKLAKIRSAGLHALLLHQHQTGEDLVLDSAPEESSDFYRGQRGASENETQIQPMTWQEVEIAYNAFTTKLFPTWILLQFDFVGFPHVEIPDTTYTVFDLIQNALRNPEKYSGYKVFRLPDHRIRIVHPDTTAIQEIPDGLIIDTAKESNKRASPPSESDPFNPGKRLEMWIAAAALGLLVFAHPAGALTSPMVSNTASFHFWPFVDEYWPLIVPGLLGLIVMSIAFAGNEPGGDDPKDYEQNSDQPTTVTSPAPNTNPIDPIGDPAEESRNSRRRFLMGLAAAAPLMTLLISIPRPVPGGTVLQSSPETMQSFKLEQVNPPLDDPAYYALKVGPQLTTTVFEKRYVQFVLTPTINRYDTFTDFRIEFPLERRKNERNATVIYAVDGKKLGTSWHLSSWTVDPGYQLPSQAFVGELNGSTIVTIPTSEIKAPLRSWKNRSLSHFNVDPGNSLREAHVNIFTPGPTDKPQPSTSPAPWKLWQWLRSYAVRNLGVAAAALIVYSLFGALQSHAATASALNYLAIPMPLDGHPFLFVLVFTVVGSITLGSIYIGILYWLSRQPFIQRIRRWLHGTAAVHPSSDQTLLRQAIEQNSLVQGFHKALIEDAENPHNYRQLAYPSLSELAQYFVDAGVTHDDLKQGIPLRTFVEVVVNKLAKYVQSSNVMKGYINLIFDWSSLSITKISRKKWSAFYGTVGPRPAANGIEGLTQGLAVQRGSFKNALRYLGEQDIPQDEYVIPAASQPDAKPNSGLRTGLKTLLVFLVGYGLAGILSAHGAVAHPAAALTGPGPLHTTASGWPLSATSIVWLLSGGIGALFGMAQAAYEDWHTNTDLAAKYESRDYLRIKEEFHEKVLLHDLSDIGFLYVVGLTVELSLWIAVNHWSAMIGVPAIVLSYMAYHRWSAFNTLESTASLRQSAAADNQKQDRGDEHARPYFKWLITLAAPSIVAWSMRLFIHAGRTGELTSLHDMALPTALLVGPILAATILLRRSNFWGYTYALTGAVLIVASFIAKIPGSTGLAFLGVFATLGIGLFMWGLDSGISTQERIEVSPSRNLFKKFMFAVAALWLVFSPHSAGALTGPLAAYPSHHRLEDFLTWDWPPMLLIASPIVFLLGAELWRHYKNRQSAPKSSGGGTGRSLPSIGFGEEGGLYAGFERGLNKWQRWETMRPTVHLGGYAESGETTSPGQSDMEKIKKLLPPELHTAATTIINILDAFDPQLDSSSHTNVVRLTFASALAKGFDVTISYLGTPETTAAFVLRAPSADTIFSNVHPPHTIDETANEFANEALSLIAHDNVGSTTNLKPIVLSRKQDGVLGEILGTISEEVDNLSDLNSEERFYIVRDHIKVIDNTLTALLDALYRCRKDPNLLNKEILRLLPNSQEGRSLFRIALIDKGPYTEPRPRDGHPELGASRFSLMFPLGLLDWFASRRRQKSPKQVVPSSSLLPSANLLQKRAKFLFEALARMMESLPSIREHSLTDLIRSAYGSYGVADALPTFAETGIGASELSKLLVGDSAPEHTVANDYLYVISHALVLSRAIGISPEAAEGKLPSDETLLNELAGDRAQNRELLGRTKAILLSETPSSLKNIAIAAISLILALVPKPAQPQVNPSPIPPSLPPIEMTVPLKDSIYILKQAVWEFRLSPEKSSSELGDTATLVIDFDGKPGYGLHFSRDGNDWKFVPPTGPQPKDSPYVKKTKARAKQEGRDLKITVYRGEVNALIGDRNITAIRSDEPPSVVLSMLLYREEPYSGPNRVVTPDTVTGPTFFRLISRQTSDAILRSEYLEISFPLKAKDAIQETTLAIDFDGAPTYTLHFVKKKRGWEIDQPPLAPNDSLADGLMKHSAARAYVKKGELTIEIRSQDLDFYVRQNNAASIWQLRSDMPHAEKARIRPRSSISTPSPFPKFMFFAIVGLLLLGKPLRAQQSVGSWTNRNVTSQESQAIRRQDSLELTLVPQNIETSETITVYVDMNDYPGYILSFKRHGSWNILIHPPKELGALAKVYANLTAATVVKRGKTLVVTIPTNELKNRLGDDGNQAISGFRASGKTKIFLGSDPVVVPQKFRHQPKSRPIETSA